MNRIVYLQLFEIFNFIIKFIRYPIETDRILFVGLGGGLGEAKAIGCDGLQPADGGVVAPPRPFEKAVEVSHEKPSNTHTPEPGRARPGRPG